MTHDLKTLLADLTCAEFISLTSSAYHCRCSAKPSRSSRLVGSRALNQQCDRSASTARLTAGVTPEVSGGRIMKYTGASIPEC